MEKTSSPDSQRVLKIRETDLMTTVVKMIEIMAIAGMGTDWVSVLKDSRAHVLRDSKAHVPKDNKDHVLRDNKVHVLRDRVHVPKDKVGSTRAGAAQETDGLRVTDKTETRDLSDREQKAVLVTAGVQEQDPAGGMAIRTVTAEAAVRALDPRQVQRIPRRSVRKRRGASVRRKISVPRKI